jgi:hypothetical protein
VIFKVPFENTPSVTMTINNKPSGSIANYAVYVDRVSNTGFNYIVRNATGTTTRMDVDLGFIVAEN